MHREFTSLMSLALDHEASDEQQSQLSRHLMECAACAATWREWQGLHRRLVTAPAVAVPPTLLPGLLARLEQRATQQHQRRWIVPGVLVAWIGVVLALWCATALFAWWAYRNPVAFSLVVSSGRQVLDQLAWLWSEAAAQATEPRLAAVSMTVALIAAAGGIAGMLWIGLLVRIGALRPVSGQDFGTSR